MTPQSLFVMVVGLSAIAGLAHMLGQTLLFVVVFATSPLWWPEVFGFYPAVIAYAASLVISTTTMLIAGIPAALVERARRDTSPSALPHLVWLGGVVIVTLAGLALGRG